MSHHFNSRNHLSLPAAQLTFTVCVVSAAKRFFLAANFFNFVKKKKQKQKNGKNADDWFLTATTKVVRLAFNNQLLN